MTAGNRLPVWTFGISLLLHLLAMMSMQKWTWLHPPSEAPNKTRYVMRLQQPAPTPAPTATPMTVPAPIPIDPTPVAPIVQPQLPKPIERVQIEPAPAKIPKVRPTKVKPVAKQSPDAQPRRPTTPKKRVVQPAPARRPTKPSPPRAAPVPPRPVQPAPPQVAAIEPPRPPSSPSKSAMPSRSQSSDADPDALKAYLNIIFQTLEKHKRYPKYAKRHSMNGQVVLKFVILADGRVVNPQITKSDGHKSFRTEALRALSRIGHMPPFPSGIRRPQLLVEVPISYQIKKR